MKTKLAKFIITSLLVVASRCGYSQGFMNLNFEDANIPKNLPSNAIAATNAFPYWTVNAQYIVYDDLSLSGESISIIDSNSIITPHQIQGAYYALLVAANFQGGSSISLSQTGQIPSSTQVIEFWGQIGGLQITFDNQLLSFSEVGSTANYNIYAADISAYAGDIGQLTFTLPSNTSQAELDNIQFLSTPVPEPGTLGLSVLGGLFFLWRYRQKYPR